MIDLLKLVVYGVLAIILLGVSVVCFTALGEGSGGSVWTSVFIVFVALLWMGDI